MEGLNFKPPGLTKGNLWGWEVRFQSLRSREIEKIEMFFIGKKILISTIIAVMTLQILACHIDHLYRSCSA